MHDCVKEDDFFVRNVSGEFYWRMIVICMFNEVVNLLFISISKKSQHFSKIMSQYIEKMQGVRPHIHTSMKLCVNLLYFSSNKHVLMRWFFKISWKNGWFFIRFHFFIKTSFKIDTEGWYCVMKGNISFSSLLLCFRSLDSLSELYIW